MSSGIALTDKAQGNITVQGQIYADVAAAQLERLRRKIQVGACYSSLHSSHGDEAARGLRTV